MGRPFCHFEGPMTDILNLYQYYEEEDANTNPDTQIETKNDTKTKKIKDPHIQRHKDTACLSGAAKLARRQRGEKKCDPRERGSSAVAARWIIS